MSTSPQSGTDGSITLNLPGRYACLGAIRQAVLHISARAGLSEIKSAQLEMAVDEACSNVIEHSYGGESDSSELRVRLIREPGGITVEICDRGAGFDFDTQPARAPSDYLDERRQRGLGMFIIRCFVDSASYQRATPDGNCLRLTKHA